MGRGVTGLILKAMRADDYVFTVLSTEKVNEHYRRIRFDGGDFLTENPWFPTMWVRLWIPKSGEATTDEDDGTLVQRGYTIIDPQGSEFTIEFAIHDGPAPRWAGDAAPGDRIAATMMGADLTVPESPAPSEFVLVGDAASIPAINSLLSTAKAPCRVFLEYQHDAERELPVHTENVTWVPRESRGATLVSTVTKASIAADAFLFVAAETKATREITRAAKKDFGLPKERIKSQAYWLQRG
ncbi:MULTISPECIES: siderophore-interacting protein [Tsukamurella]|uniref:Siderophore-interacting protein n=1 Tax=Tsukamurella strandjordii TaxID=147577 RepID=A0AA90N7A8_9ACTN|nr:MULTISPECIES: siderophore-interacting protein [Tsukamurella]MDP0396902.1 siderophore-interacting protein [Tsukamurella strandjordii]GIZ96704.1 putative siderophore-interacting protein [Tsukamurella sp. TY48]